MNGWRALLLCVCLLASGAAPGFGAQQDRWEDLARRTLNSYEQGRYAEAKALAQAALRLAETSFGPEHPNVATSLNDLGTIQQSLGAYAVAAELLQRSLQIREKSLGPHHPDVAQSANNLGLLYTQLGNYAEAERQLQRTLVIWQRVHGSRHLDVATALNNLADLYHSQGRYDQAEPLFRRSLEILESLRGLDDSYVAMAKANLALLYRDRGRLKEAETLYLGALAVLERALGPAHPSVATILSRLALLNQDRGNYAAAEALHRRALEIRQKVLGSEHPQVAASLNSIGVLYLAQGKYEEAERLVRQALAIREKAYGADHESVAESVNNLAAMYKEQLNYAAAVPLIERALRIREKVLGPAHPEFVRALNNLAVLHHMQNNYAAAEALFQRGMKTLESQLEANHPSLGNLLSNRAFLYQDMERYDEAEQLYLRALNIQEKSLGTDHPGTGITQANLATLYYRTGSMEKAAAAYAGALQNLRKQFEKQFAYMNEQERLLFLDSISYVFPVYFSFCYAHRDRDPALVSSMYDVVLWQKGIVGSSVTALRTRIEASGDREALGLLEQLSVKRSELAKLLTAGPTDSGQLKETIARLRQETDELERTLVGRSSAQARESQLAGIKWRDVQQKLQPGEAAVEFVRFRFHDSKNWAQKYLYVALVLTTETKSAPKLVEVGEASDLEGPVLLAYRELVKPEPPAGDRVGRALYAVEGDGKTTARGTAGLWKRLEAALGGARRVYLSPDGALNQLAWGVIPLPGEKVLLEVYDVRIVSSTRQILMPKRPATGNSAILIGNPKFDLTEVEQRETLRTFPTAGTPHYMPSPDLNRGLQHSKASDKAGRIVPLPGTAAELQSVSSLLKQRGWNVELHAQENAVEEAVKRARSPRLLHVATHGFFIPDQEVVHQRGLRLQPTNRTDPMLRSGLLFGGAERVFSGGPPVFDLDDGVLTAYEALGLRLHGTELVILSACETGLGEVKNGEGVFGLRRALEVAGAESILMSMWAVPDRETQELMTLFYEKWLGGKHKHEALREAQLEMRRRTKARYGQDRPFFWGAFVLAGA